MLLDQRHVHLLRAAVLDGEDARAAYEAWRAALVWDDLDPPSQRLIPLLHRRLVAAGVEDPLLHRMRGLHRRAWVVNELRLEDGARAAGALVEAGIDVILLKGAAIAVRWIDDPGLRPMGDLDLLVRPADAPRAIERLVASGWQAVAGDPTRFDAVDLARIHAAGLRAASGEEIDLHWRALREGSSGDEPLWARAEPADLRGVPVRVLAPEDHVFHACAHAATWAAFGRIDWIADAAVIVRSSGAGFDWDRVASLAVAERLEIPVAELLATLEEVVGLGVPDRVVRRLRLRRPRVLDRVEASARRQRPGDLGRVAAAVVAVQDHRRRVDGLRRRPALVGLPSFARQRWGVEGTRAAVGYAAYAAAGRPARVRPWLVGRHGGVAAARATGGAVVGDDGVADLATGAGFVAGWSFPEAGEEREHVALDRPGGRRFLLEAAGPQR
jgi:hypothetical protein